MPVFDRKESVCVCVRLLQWTNSGPYKSRSPRPCCDPAGSKIIVFPFCHKLFSYLFDKNDFSVIKLAAVLVDDF